MSEFSGKRVAVAGFGIEGQAAVGFLLQDRIIPLVYDEKPETDFSADTVKAYRDQGVEFHFATLDGLEGADVIIRSPGIQPEKPALLAAHRKGIEITSITKIFFERAKGITIGVTGTKGKGTTSSLIAEILKNAGKDVHLGGNIGLPAISFVEDLTDDSYTVYELSSFQLMDLTRSPHIAVVLMVTSEHLDYHPTQGEYVEAKAPIVKFQSSEDMVVANRDYEHSFAIANRSHGKKFWVSRRGAVQDGCFIGSGKVMIAEGGAFEEIIETKDIFLPGPHNLENICAATMVARLLGVPNAVIRETLEKFRGLPHRLEFVGQVDGVRYFNDSFSTTPESAIAAVNAFTMPKVMILGGSTKGADFSTLGALIAHDGSVKAIVGIGVEWPKIKDAILRAGGHVPVLVEGCVSMGQIVERARGVASPGDVIVLSPACASFDMFKSYKDRGEQFKKAVLGLS